MTIKTNEIIPTGFPMLDSLFGGLKPAQLVLLASRPSVGKTSFALSLAKNITVENNIPTAYFSLEEGAERIARKFLCQVEDITLEQAFGAQKCDMNMEELNEKFSSIPLYIDDTPAIKPDEILAKSERLVKESGVKVIIVDYVQLVSIGGYKKEMTWRKKVGKIVQKLKQISVQLNVPIIGLCQVAKKINYSSPEFPPNLSELSYLAPEIIEQYVDMAWLLVRCSINGKVDYNKLKSELIVVYNSHSEHHPVIELNFDADYGRFIDLKEDIEES